jgi:hypothetical protein
MGDAQADCLRASYEALRAQAGWLIELDSALGPSEPSPVEAAVAKAYGGPSKAPKPGLDVNAYL